MAREMVSILYDDWRKVPMETKMFIWESIQQKFKLDDGEHKAYTLQMVGKLWRAYKSRLRRKLSKCKRKDLKKFKPSGSEQVEWYIFQKRRLSKDFTICNDFFCHIWEGFWGSFFWSQLLWHVI